MGPTALFLRGTGTVEEAQQYGGLRTELLGPVGVRGRGELRGGFESLGDLGAYDVHDTALTELDPHGFGRAGPDRRLLQGHAPQLGFTDWHRLGVVQRTEGRAQGTHGGFVAGSHGFGQGLTHTET